MWLLQLFKLHLSEEKRCENNDSVNDITYSSHNHSEIHFKAAVEDRNTITDHDIKRNDVSGNINLKHPNVLNGTDLRIIPTPREITL